MPSTGGGGKTATKAPWMLLNLAFRAPASAKPERSFRFRSSNGLSGKNTMPPFDAFTNPLMERPVNATASCTPSCSMPMRDISRITASVRSSVAASGSWAKAMRYCLSCVGTKPVGTVRNMTTVTTEQHGVDGERHRRARNGALHAAAVLLGAALEHAS